MNPETFSTSLQSLLPNTPLQTPPQTASTNTDAKAWALQGAPHGALIATQLQTAGRGRQGRSFASPLGGIYFSTILHPPLQLPAAGLVTAAAAVAVCRAVTKLCSIELCIKWVNDLFFQNKKCCGILVETVHSGTSAAIIVGIGINYTTTNFPKELADIAGSLFPNSVPPATAAQLVAETHSQLMSIFSALPNNNFLEEYRSRSIVLGKQVCASTTPPICGIATSINHEAQLVIKTSDGTLHTIGHGEISLNISPLNPATRRNP